MPTLEETLRDKVAGLEERIVELEADKKALRSRIKGFETTIEYIYQEMRRYEAYNYFSK